MSDFVPDDIKTKLAVMLAKNGTESRARETAEQEGGERRKRLRMERAGELAGALVTINAWVGRFVERGAPTDPIWRVINRLNGIVLFEDRFWQYEPAPRLDETRVAELVLDSSRGNLCYQERKGERILLWHDIGLVISEDSARARAADPWQPLHPEFVMRAARHIESGAVWDTIRTLLDRFDCL